MHEEPRVEQVHHHGQNDLDAAFAVDGENDDSQGQPAEVKACDVDLGSALALTRVQLARGLRNEHPEVLQ